MRRCKAERDHAESRAVRALLAAIYPEEHPYRFPLAGTEASVERLDRSSLADFHARFLISARPTVIVAGDVDPDELAQELERRLTPWKGTVAKALRPAGHLAVGASRDCSCSTALVPRRRSCGLDTSGLRQFQP